MKQLHSSYALTPSAHLPSLTLTTPTASHRSARRATAVLPLSITRELLQILICGEFLSGLNIRIKNITQLAQLVTPSLVSLILSPSLSLNISLCFSMSTASCIRANINNTYTNSCTSTSMCVKRRQPTRN